MRFVDSTRDMIIIRESTEPSCVTLEIVGDGGMHRTSHIAACNPANTHIHIHIYADVQCLSDVSEHLFIIATRC